MNYFFSIYLQFRGCADSIRTTFGLNDASLSNALHYLILHFMRMRENKLFILNMLGTVAMLLTQLKAICNVDLFPNIKFPKTSVLIINKSNGLYMLPRYDSFGLLSINCMHSYPTVSCF